MTDYPGDPSKRPQDCKIDEPFGKCENMKSTYDGWDGERYRCEVCGKSYFLDYEDMK